MDLRFIEITGGTDSTKSFIYYAKNIIPITCFSAYNNDYVPGWSYVFKPDYTPIVFKDSAYFTTGDYTGNYNKIIFVVFVQENQPIIERVSSVSNVTSINVYNENGVLVCSNDGKSVNSSPSNTNVPGEMTSVPGEEPGEMAGETTDEPVAMI